VLKKCEAQQSCMAALEEAGEKWERVCVCENSCGPAQMKKNGPAALAVLRADKRESRE